MMSHYTVKYRVVGNGRRPHALEVDTVGRLTQRTARRLISQARSVPQRDVEIVSIKEARR